MSELWRDPKAPVWILDNRDSFVFNLAHRVFEAGQNSFVIRSDVVTPDYIRFAEPRAIIISPGPGHPATAGGASVEVVRQFTGHIPILGVCLGHQAIVHAFDGVVEPNDAPMHGKASQITLSDHRIFEGIESPTAASRYHALALREVPHGLRPIGWLEDETVMAVSDATNTTIGLQFHPESVLSPTGLQMLENFLGIAGLRP